MSFNSRYNPLFLLIVALLACKITADERPSLALDVPDGQPRLVRLAATVDGSERIAFTRGKTSYEHKHWGKPTNVRFDGTPWPNMETTPAAWAEYSHQLDLTKAKIVKREGRDVIALEHTPDGFDLYLCDSPDKSGDYEVTIAIPRRK
jgi:hypothetical protein